MKPEIVITLAEAAKAVTTLALSRISHGQTRYSPDCDGIDITILWSGAVASQNSNVRFIALADVL